MPDEPRRVRARTHCRRPMFARATSTHVPGRSSGSERSCPSLRPNLHAGSCPEAPGKLPRLRLPIDRFTEAIASGSGVTRRARHRRELPSPLESRSTSVTAARPRRLFTALPFSDPWLLQASGHLERSQRTRLDGTVKPRRSPFPANPEASDQPPNTRAGAHTRTLPTFERLMPVVQVSNAHETSAEVQRRTGTVNGRRFLTDCGNRWARGSLLYHRVGPICPRFLCVVGPAPGWTPGVPQGLPARRADLATARRAIHARNSGHAASLTIRSCPPQSPATPLSPSSPSGATSA